MPEDNAPQPLRLAALIAEGYLAPRKSMARVLALRPDEPERLMMVAIGIVGSALGYALMGGQTVQDANGQDVEFGPAGVLLGYIVTIFAGLFQYYVLARLIGFVSRATGGVGDQDADRTLVAWWTLVTAPLPVIMMASYRNIEMPLAPLLMVASAILTMVLLAAYIRQAHGFSSTARVCGAMIGILMLFSFVFRSLLPVPA